MSEGEGLDEEDDEDEEEGGAETEEQSGNESEMNEQEEDVSSCAAQMIAALLVTLDSEEEIHLQHLVGFTFKLPPGVSVCRLFTPPASQGSNVGIGRWRVYTPLA